MTGSFNNLQSFWHMGGYAAYVWSAYGIAACLLGFQLCFMTQKWRRLRKKLLEYVKSS